MVAAMCFSATADLVAGVAVGAASVVGLRAVRHPRDLALASVPLVLGAHLLVEAVVWRGLEGDVDRALWRPAMYAYLVIAFGVVPVLVPAAIALIEPNHRRPRFVAFVVAGVAAAVVLVAGLIEHPVAARIDGHHIRYDVTVWLGVVTVGLYVLATCGPALLSSDPVLRIFGVLNVAAVAGLAVLQRNGLVSLWCAWAAIVSIAIAFHLRSERRHRHRSDQMRRAGATGEPAVVA